MKTHLSFTLVLFFLVYIGSVYGQVRKSDEGVITIGYCSSEIKNGVGVGSPQKLSAAIYFPGSTMEKYKGATIKTLRIGLYNRNFSDLKIFVSDNLYGTYIYEQSVKGASNGWNEITLTVPYKIDGSELYIGYSLSTSSNPIGLDDGPINDMANNLCINGLWDNVKQFGGSLSIQAVLEGVSIEYDASLKSVDVNEYVKRNKEFEITGTIQNKGSKAINSFDLKYKIGDQAVINKKIAGVEILNNGTYEFKIFDVIIPELGKYTIEVSIDNLNGNPDQNTSDNVLKVNVECLPDVATRKVLVENFTTARCINCPRAHALMERTFGSNDHVIIVAHHAGYYTDAYTLPQDMEYTNFYGGGVYAPALMADRVCPDSKPVPVINADDAAMSFINQRLKTAAIASVKIDTDYDPVTKVVDLNVSGELFIDIPETCFLTVYIVEDGIIGYQEGSGSNYTHNHVVRSILTNTFGDKLELSGGKFSKTYTITVGNGWVFENLKVVAFVNKYSSTHFEKCEILNAEQSSISRSIGVQQNEFSSINVYMDNQQKILNIKGEYDALSIYNSLGILVKQFNDSSSEINLSEFTGGIYLVRLSQRNQSLVRKIQIQ